MPHIADYMITDSDGDLNSLKSYISSTSSTKASTNSLGSSHSRDDQNSFARRMKTKEQCMYKLFPQPKQQQQPSIKVSIPEQTPAVTVSQSHFDYDKPEKTGLSNAILSRIKEHNPIKRRKVSIPERGRPTTVRDFLEDSPTIPGRPALYERSISTPVNTLRMNLTDGPKPNPKPAPASKPTVNTSVLPDAKTLPARQPLSPKDLAQYPAIPRQTGKFPSVSQRFPFNLLRKVGSSQDLTARLRREESPPARARFASFTPPSSLGSATPRSGTPSAPNIPPPSTQVPISAPEPRRPPCPWVRSHSSIGTTPTAVTTKPEPEVHPRRASASPNKTAQVPSGSIMERGRPLRRAYDAFMATNPRRPKLKRSPSAEKRAFETLPQGYGLRAAPSKLDQAELAHLQRQALGQAALFEVLKKEDVDNLSKELRLLDAKTEYLRHTYTSLRAGRRNLQSRICTYLRAPRVATFSYESVLRQEESLAELDASIDDWAANLEYAENRRMRVRQKLLEHVAAAAATTSNGTTRQTLPTQMQLSATDLMTIPGSPAETGRFLDVFTTPGGSRSSSRGPPPPPPSQQQQSESRKSSQTRTTKSALQRMESIRIYADNEIHSLLKDVETNFADCCVLKPKPQPQPPARRTRKVPSRSRSQDVIVVRGSVSKGAVLDNQLPPSPPAPLPPRKDLEFLTAAVFQAPSTSVNG